MTLAVKGLMMMMYSLGVGKGNWQVRDSRLQIMNLLAFNTLFFSQLLRGILKKRKHGAYFFSPSLAG